ncbi:TonB-dependent receptor [Blastomonas sp. AAP53]|uniref:TonB-dependent receptor n=1 Tax=Blastomonas sp. AAP53 TaxID=1248760 RepID=UPI00047563B4|nr:TonB-dependent receptor [Blastomonas sp. AAP53]
MRRPSLALLAIPVVMLSTPVLAQAPVSIDIAAGRLDDAIIALGRQAGISIGIGDRRLGAQRVRRLRGHMTPQQALERLLNASEARPVRLASGHWRIVRATPATRRSGAPIRLAMLTPRQATAPVEEIVVTAAAARSDLLTRDAFGHIQLDGEFALGGQGRGSDALVERLPGLGSTQLGPGRNRLFLRAIADSSFNGPSQAVVGQYLGTARLNYNAPDPDLRLVDLSAIEVRQGPQGTLYGAGTLGGVIRLLPNMPDLEDWQAGQSVALAATRHGDPSANASAMLNAPIVAGKLGLRAVIYGGRDGGYIDDRLRGRSDVNRVDTIGGRISARITPGAGWTIDLMAAAQTIDGRDSQYADRRGDGLDRASPFAQPFRNRFRLGQAAIGKQWDAFELLSTTTVTGLDLTETFDTSQPGSAPSLFRQHGQTRLITNETRLSGETAGGIGWLAGTSLLSNRYRIRRARGSVERSSAITGIENRVEEATAFADLTIPATDRLFLDLGGRVSHVRLSGEALDTPLMALAVLARSSAQRNQTAFLPSAGVRYRFSDAVSGHARYQEGFRPGGIGVRDDMVRRYRPDNVSAVEAGLAFSGGSLSGDVTLAYTRWRNIQADLIDSDGLPATENIGNGRIVTVDATLAWQPVPAFSVEASAVWADSRLVSPSAGIFVLPANRAGFDFASIPAGAVIADSNALPNVARLSGRMAANYRTSLGGAGDLMVGGSMRYIGRSRLGIGPVLGVEQGDVLDTALSASLTRGGRSFWLQASNLLDTRGNRFALGSPFTLPHGEQTTPLRPRTITIGADFSF